MNESSDNDCGLETEMTKYSEKWKIVRKATYIPNDLYRSSRAKIMKRLIPKPYPRIPARIAI